MGFLKHYIFPLVVMLGGPITIQVLHNFTLDETMEGMYPVEEYLEGFKLKMLLGNTFSWIVTITWITWNVFYLAIPFDHYIGRMTLFGYSPKYVHNGASVYTNNLLAFLMFHSFYPYLSYNIYLNMPYIIASFNIVGLLLMFGMWILGDSQRIRLHKEEKLEKVSYLYELLRGMELHPNLFDVDIKQMLVRIGFSSWQMLVLCYMVMSYLQHKFDPGMFAITIIQCVYLFYFFKWEKGFLIALDMTYGRCGFYFCWGCLNWVPFFYSYATYYLVDHPTSLNSIESVIAIVVCSYLIRFKFQVDEQKYAFRQSNGVDCNIWGQKATYLDVQYQTAAGAKESRLLTAGYWGVARHMNYTLELVCALAWSLLTYRVHTVLTFLYPIYLLLLLVHRTYRDEEKCSAKYGTYWNKYCSLVKYRMIPHLF